MTIEEAKAEARALRAALQAQGTPISHAQALEAIARRHGAKDWNTLHGRLAAGEAPARFAVGDRVRGRYLGQAFTGEVLRLAGPAGHRRIEIRFDHPVDVVRFESFTNLRRRIRATIDEEGRSHGHTSDGTPHLIVEREAG
ncbi:MAG: glyoxalase superfamily protein [Amaricoccus sp.]